MDTLIVNKASKEDLELLIRIAKRMGIDIEYVPKNAKNKTSEPAPFDLMTKEEKEKHIMELSKKVNKAGTKRWFKEMGLDYDSYFGQQSTH